MSFIAPLWLGAAALAGVGIVVAHLLSATIPPQDVLPTVRFIPESVPLTVTRSRKLSDVVLLLLRLAAVALLGFALAGAHVAQTAPRRVVLLDVSRAVAKSDAADDIARIAISDASILIEFDSVARAVTHDTAARDLPVGGRGSLSAALVLAQRLTAKATTGREQSELVVVSPLAAEEFDSATAPLVAMWDGPVRVVSLPMAPAPATPSWEYRGAADDPVAAALSRVPRRGAGNVRVVRGLATHADSQWAGAGRALVVWPVDGIGLTPRAVADSQGGIAVGRSVVVSQFRRSFDPRAGRAVVRWLDGQPASAESALGQGCVREVAIPVDAVGDVALRDSFRGVVQTLIEPCGGARDFMPASLPSSQPRAAGTVTADAGSLPLWLAVLAAFALLIEQLLRNRRRVTA